MTDDERIEHLELEVKVLRENNKGLKDKIDEQSKEIEHQKEKGENVKLRLQDIPLMEGEVKAYKDRVNELNQELEKEKEDNKRLRKCHLQYEEMTGIDLLLPEKEE